MEIILMIAGASIGAGISWFIAYKFHKKAGKDLQAQINSIKELNDLLAESVRELTDISKLTAEKAEIIETHTVAGTSDDPRFPYK